MNVRLLLDPALVCERFRAARVPRQALSDHALPHWSPLDGFCLTLTGPSTAFSVVDPPALAFRFPYDGSVALKQATAVQEWTEAACDTIGQVCLAAAHGPVKIRISSHSLLSLGPVDDWIEQGGAPPYQ